MQDRQEQDGLTWEALTPATEPTRVIEIGASVSRMVLEFRAERGTEARSPERVIAF